MSPFLVSIVVSAALGAAAPCGPACDKSGLRKSLEQERGSSRSNSSTFEQYFKDNAPKSTKDQEAVLLKKEQELLAAEQALLAKEQLLLKGSPPTTPPANSSTQAVKPPAVNEPQQESVVTERARLATPQMTPKEDVKANQVKKKESPLPLQETPSEPTKRVSVEAPPVQAVNSAAKISGIEATNQQPHGNESSQTKNETAAKTDVAPVPVQQSASPEELEALRKRNTALEQELAELRKRLASKERSVGEKDQTASQAVRELNETRARLMLAETQVERLSSIIEARNDCTISQLTGETRQRPAPAATSRLPVVPKVESSAEMPIATVVKKKVYLRTGPGKNNSPLMAVSEGTRLAVETMQGEWYRVITPTGARAWVAAESIAFGNGGKIAPARSTSAPTAAAEQSEEDKAFELLKRR